MAFTKFINFTSAFVSAVFNEAHGAMWAINGRLSGFYPAAVGGDPLTPGIASVLLPSLDMQRTITVNLNAPGTADDLRFPPAGQTTSFCLANGVLLKSDSLVTLSLTMVDTGAPPLTDPNRIIIYAQYDDSAAAPTFAAARESVIDIAPTNKAKLAFYDPGSQTWQPMPQLSVGGIFQTAVDVTSKFGGLLATRLDSGTLKVTPGTVVGSFGRISSSGIRLVPSLSFPATGKFRKDLLVITDPQSTTNELTQPVFTILRGKREAVDVINTEPVPVSLDPKQVPLAEIMMSSTGIGEVIDIRPIMAWQTDSMMQSAPLALQKIDINTIQPGFIATDTTQGVNVGWGLAVFRGLLSTTGGVKNSSMAIGLVGPPQVRGSITGPVAPGLFVPDATAFPPKPWILEDSFQIVRDSDLADITHSKVYFPPDGNASFDFKNGIFVPPGITTQSPLESFTVNFRQLQAIFVIDDDGVIHVPDIDAFYRHIRVDNPAAHIAFNIIYNNSLIPVPGHPTSEPKISVQTAIEALAQKLLTPIIAGAHLESWRCRLAPITFVAASIVQLFNFIGPSGYVSPYTAGPPAAPDDTVDDGIIFFPPAGNIIGVYISMIASYVGSPGNLGTNWRYALWVDSLHPSGAEFELTTAETGPVSGTMTQKGRGSFTFDPPINIASGQFARLGLTSPSIGGAPVTIAAKLTLTLDFVVELT